MTGLLSVANLRPWISVSTARFGSGADRLPFTSLPFQRARAENYTTSPHLFRTVGACCRSWQRLAAPVGKLHSFQKMVALSCPSKRQFEKLKCWHLAIPFRSRSKLPSRTNGIGQRGGWCQRCSIADSIIGLLHRATGQCRFPRCCQPDRMMTAQTLSLMTARDHVVAQRHQP